MINRTMIDPKYYVARRDTRWDVYPQQEPEVVVAHDWWGFWERAPQGFWFQTPRSFVLVREISEQEANQ